MVLSILFEIAEIEVNIKNEMKIDIDMKNEIELIWKLKCTWKT